LLQKGAALELDQAITILRTAEATQLAAHLRQSDLVHLSGLVNAIPGVH
jgi:hypothetical protein